MKRILGLDFESTGLDTKEARIIEVGAVVWDVEAKFPLVMESYFLALPEGMNLEPIITKLTGITDEHLKEFGIIPAAGLHRLKKMVSEYGVEAIVAHNGIGFDLPLLKSELSRHGVDAPSLLSLPVIDTRLHLPFKDKPDSTKLKYISSDHGFLMTFQHRALFDVMAMLKVFSCYDIKAILEEKDVPRIIVRAVVPSPFGAGNDNGVGKDKAKALGYRWESWDDHKFPKCWVKLIKEEDFLREKESLPDYEVIAVGSA